MLTPFLPQKNLYISKCFKVSPWDAWTPSVFQILYRHSVLRRRYLWVLRQMLSCWTFRQMGDQSPSCITSTNVGPRKLWKPDQNSADYFWEHIDFCAFFTVHVKENLQYKFLITFNFCKLLIKLSILASKIPQTFSGASSGAHYIAVWCACSLGT